MAAIALKLRQRVEYQIDTKEDENKDTLKYLLDSSIEYLIKHNINESRLIAELIFSKVLKISHMTLFMKYDMKINNEDKNKIREYFEEFIKIIQNRK